jgi:hypothetical protein
MVTAPIRPASRRLTGSQADAATPTMTPSSEEEQPLKMAGSALSRSARMSSRAAMGTSENDTGFGQQVAGEDQDDGPDDAEHADLGSLGLVIAPMPSGTRPHSSPRIRSTLPSVGMTPSGALRIGIYSAARSATNPWATSAWR